MNIDFVAKNPWRLVLVENGPWDDFEKVLYNIQDKLSQYGLHFGRCCRALGNNLSEVSMVKLFFGFLAGLVVASLVFTALLYRSFGSADLPNRHLVKLMESASLNISDENWSCESYVENSIGHVASMIFSENIRSKWDQVNFGCINESCHFSLNYCKLWQSSECSTLILRYGIDQDSMPIETTAQCILMP